MSKNYERILVAYDGSKSSANALKEAAELAKLRDAEMLVLTVTHVPEVAIELMGMGDVEGIISESADELLKEGEKLAREAGCKKVKPIMKRGVPFKMILEAAEQEKADLIAMGRRGITRLERVFIGSTTTRVIGQAKCDVMVMPRGGKVGTKAALATTDGSKCGDNAVARAINFTSAYGVPKLSIVSVVDANDEFMALAPKAVEKMTEHAKDIVQEAAELAKKEGVKTDVIVKTGKPSVGIMDAAKASGVDVIFMGTHGRTGLGRMIMGSATQDLIAISDRPVIITKSS